MGVQNPERCPPLANKESPEDGLVGARGPPSLPSRDLLQGLEVSERGPVMPEERAVSEHPHVTPSPCTPRKLPTVSPAGVCLGHGFDNSWTEDSRF